MFFLFAMVTCVATWLLGGLGAILYVVFDAPCTMMELHLQGIRNLWLDENLPCNELRDVILARDSAMESANLAIEAANDEINGMVSYALTF